MASMRDLFPMHNYRKKAEKNFIRENIQKVKGCEQCLLEKKMMKMSSTQQKYKARKPVKQTTEVRPKTPSIKCNVKIIRHGNSACKATIAQDTKRSASTKESDKNLITQGCQTESQFLCDKEIPVMSCQNCGQLINRNTMQNVPAADSDDGHVPKSAENKEETLNCSTTVKKENQTKKECSSKKTLDLSTYKMGIVPRYLKERNAKLEQELKEKREREKLAQELGLNDPKCPPGHMLMPKHELQDELNDMERRFDELIKQLNMMPVSSDSYRVKQRKIQVEKGLDELEAKIDLYRSGKVFVKIPDLSVGT